DRELLLDQMNVDEALRLRGGAAAAAPESVNPEPGARYPDQVPGARYRVPEESDWRAALRGSGVGPQSAGRKATNGGEAPPDGVEHATPRNDMRSDEEPSPIAHRPSPDA